MQSDRCQVRSYLHVLGKLLIVDDARGKVFPLLLTSYLLEVTMIDRK